MHDRELLTAPLYEPSEAARLAQISVSRVRRWLFGYNYTVGIDRRVKRQGPVVHRAESTRYASFLDLIELRFARGFLDDQFSLQRLRKAFREAAEVTGLDHPFARKRFFTSGKRIYLEVRGTDKAKHLLELLSGGQWVIEPVVKQYARQVDFDPQSEAAIRWWPMGKEVPVIIDPRFSFGSPTIVNRGIRTAQLDSLYHAERRNASAVARWMEIPVDEVEAAVRFEREWSSRIAA